VAGHGNADIAGNAAEHSSWLISVRMHGQAVWQGGRFATYV
jgi:hypothetical protein